MQPAASRFQPLARIFPSGSSVATRKRLIARLKEQAQSAD
jgi:hypothetical protein